MLLGFFMLELSPFLYIFIGIAVIFGGILRGICGFGFSLTLVVALTFFLPPLLTTSLIFIWEILASILHLPFVRKHVDWKAIKWLCLGCLIGTPFGVYSLLLIPPAPMTMIINLTVIVLSLIMLRGYTLKRSLNACEIVGTGAISGIINGASANGGPPVILLFFSSPAGAGVGRASLIAYFLFTDSFASSILILKGAMNMQIFATALCYIPCLALGIWIGSKFYHRIDEQKFKRFVIILLIIISSFGCIKALLA
jgi:hypothetical protein